MDNRAFHLVSPYQPSGDQPQAIRDLVEGVNQGYPHQVLKGVTGSGKTFTMANVIVQTGRPTLILSHNKTLAAQLFREFKEFFPDNAVEYFVSYYDYYQPEAYLPSRDLYIEKETRINDEIEMLRISTVVSLITRRDVIVVATVSAIYGLTPPEVYGSMLLALEKGQEISLENLSRRLVELHYERNQLELSWGTFSIKGDTVELFPPYLKDKALRLEFDFDTLARILLIDPLTKVKKGEVDKIPIFSPELFAMPQEKILQATQAIEKEMEEHYQNMVDQGRHLEAHRIKTRVRYDIEMLRETGHCPGIENYTRYLSGLKEGKTPHTLLDYFQEHGEFLLFVDESHVTLPQIRGMYMGDKARKANLINFGFRLPSALDNRPLFYEEFEHAYHQCVYVSATPKEEELAKVSQVVEQVIRPTGLLDPEVIVRSSKGQMADLFAEIQKRIQRKERCLVTTLTKRMAEDLTDYLKDLGIKVNYLHSEIDTFERVRIIASLRRGEIDVIVGINLLREGLDIPEVSLVVILDADKLGFLRSETSLVQTIGRAARHQDGQVIMYADRSSPAMEKAIAETLRRRQLQMRYNEEHHITPRSIVKKVQDLLLSTGIQEALRHVEELKKGEKTQSDQKKLVDQLKKAMQKAIEEMRFEEAALLRDELKELGGLK